ncbi:hypothetical protein [Nocardia puris]|uniref:hypothetical protein n=1 Tax=Nocardia puris TaxID=208602 RepID=UPI0018DCD36B|nr:hypothetical protein [Nocardia puris]
MIKDAAARTDVSEAEIIRDAIHSAAMRVRRRNEPLRLRRFATGDPTLAHRVDEILAENGREQCPIPDGSSEAGDA